MIDSRWQCSVRERVPWLVATGSGRGRVMPSCFFRRLLSLVRSAISSSSTHSLTHFFSPLLCHSLTLYTIGPGKHKAKGVEAIIQLGTLAFFLTLSRTPSFLPFQPSPPALVRSFVRSFVRLHLGTAAAVFRASWKSARPAAAAAVRSRVRSSGRTRTDGRTTEGRKGTNGRSANAKAETATARRRGKQRAERTPLSYVEHEGSKLGTRRGPSYQAAITNTNYVQHSVNFIEDGKGAPSLSSLETVQIPKVSPNVELSSHSSEL